MKKMIMLVLLAICLTPVLAQAQTANLIISEYVEGSGNNKAIEIYNGTSTPLYLGNYVLERYSNGASSPTTIALDGVSLPIEGTFVITHVDADAALLALADQTNGNINFNGDDTIVLVRDGAVIDAFGQVGFDPGDEWSCAEGSTRNHTLQRRISVCEGDVDSSDVFDPCLEWEILASDVFDGLGQHEVECNSVSAPTRSWGSLKADYR